MDDTNGKETLAALGHSVLAGFKLTQPMIQDVESAREKLDIEYERFKIWARNLELLGAGHASLDYKLRRALELSRLIRLLLNNILESMRDIASIHEAEAEDSSEETQSDDSNFSAHSPDTEEATQILVNEIIDANNKLFKLATEIRSSSVRSGPGERDYLRKFAAGEDDSTDYLAQLAIVEKRLIEEHLQFFITMLVDPKDQLTPKTKQEWAAHNDLLTKLGKCNALRRLQFSFWRDSHEQRGRSLKITVQEYETVKHVEIEPIIEPSSYTGAPSTTFSPSVSQVLSSSTLDPQKFEVQKPLSTYTRVTRAPAAIDPAGQQPSWPARETLPDPSQGFFECPYCFALCPETYQFTESAWRTHLVYDTRPYVCTYHDCRSVYLLYGSKGDWADHERYTHRTVWRCPAHEDTFTTEDGYVAHVESEHAEYKAELCSQEGLINAISTSESKDRVCPLCFISLPSVRGMEAHVLFHLESIALLALPRATGLELGGEQEDTASDQLNISQRPQSVNLESLPADDNPSRFPLFHASYEATITERTPHSAYKLSDDTLRDVGQITNPSAYVIAWAQAMPSNPDPTRCTVSNGITMYDLTLQAILEALQLRFPEVESPSDFSLRTEGHFFRFWAPTIVRANDLGELLFANATLSSNKDSAVRTELNVGQRSVEYVRDQLSFEGMDVGFETASAPWSGTFDWIINGNQKAGRSFAVWIARGLSSFWIAGNPGCGKTTLMLHLFNNLNRLVELKTEFRVTIAIKYFVPIGTSLQQSYRGLLRACLYQAMDQLHFFGLALTEQAQDLERGDVQTAEVLEERFKRVLDAMPRKGLRMIFIDGLDRIVDDKVSILEFLEDIAASPNARVIVASRPIVPMIQEHADYSERNSFQLHDWNEQDIRSYARETVLQYPMLDPVAIGDEITRRSEGLFSCATTFLGLFPSLTTRDSENIMQDVFSSIREVPHNLRDFVENIQLDKNFAEERKALFSALVIHENSDQTHGPLPLEILHALQLEGVPFEAPFWIEPDAERQHEIVLLAGCDLVEVVGKGKTACVRFIHSDIRRILINCSRTKEIFGTSSIRATLSSFLRRLVWASERCGGRDLASYEGQRSMMDELYPDS